MTGILRQLRTPGVLLTALAAVVIAVAAVPLFGSTAYAAGLNQNNTVTVSRFVIPGAPNTKITAKITAAQTAPFTLTVADDVSGLFPTSGEILVSKDEVMVYNRTTCSPTAFQFCVTARAKVGTAVQHDPPETGASTDPFAPEGRVKLVTQLSAELPAAQSPQTTLAANMSSSATLPFKMTLTDASAILAAGTSGEITVSHQDADAGGQSTELMRYNNPGGGCTGLTANQLCITVRALNANNQTSTHSATGYAQPCTVSTGQASCPQGGVTKVTRHSDISVKSTDGFFPATPLLIYNLTSGLANAEIVGSVKGDAAAKLTDGPPASGTVFRVTGRGGSPGGFDKTTISTHAVNSIVTGADGFTVCRARSEQPGAFTAPAGQTPATSRVGSFAVCYTRTQPGDEPKDTTTKDLLLPIAGSTLIVLNAIGQPFLSTGGFNHTLYGAVPHVDADGTAGNAAGADVATSMIGGDCDAGGSFTLCLVTPCVSNFTPGTNLQTQVKVATDKDYTTPDTGQIRVVLDTVHDATANNGDECDDPAGTGDIILTTFDGFAGDPTAADDDTDGDGCDDGQELFRAKPSGGQRDPWNPWDFFDPNWNPLTGTGTDTVIALNNVTSTAGRFGQEGDPNGAYNPAAAAGTYNRAYDRGASYGPFSHNTAEPDGTIALADVLSIAGQFGNEC